MCLSNWEQNIFVKGHRKEEAAKYSPSLELAFKISAIFGKELTEVFQYPEAT